MCERLRATVFCTEGLLPALRLPSQDADQAGSRGPSPTRYEAPPLNALSARLCLVRGRQSRPCSVFPGGAWEQEFPRIMKRPLDADQSGSRANLSCRPLLAQATSGADPAARIGCQYFARTVASPAIPFRKITSLSASKSVHGLPLTVTVLIGAALGWRNRNNTVRGVLREGISTVALICPWSTSETIA